MLKYVQVNSLNCGGNLDSKNIQQIHQWLVRRRFVKDISIIDGDAENNVIVFISASYLGSKAVSGRTSLRQLAHLKRIAAKELGLYVNFRVTVSEDREEIESGINALVRKVLQSSDVKVFLSVSKDRYADLWFDDAPKSISENIKINMITVIKDYLKNVDLTLHEMYLHGASIPSSAMILRSVKILQPATAQEITKYIIDRGFLSVPIKWIKSQLDLLRKKKFIIWSKETYSITYEGLSSLPIVRGRSSSDIERALALGKRRW